jgi:hypothetical protein
MYVVNFLLLHCGLFVLKTDGTKLLEPLALNNPWVELPETSTVKHI